MIFLLHFFSYKVFKVQACSLKTEQCNSGCVDSENGPGPASVPLRGPAFPLLPRKEVIQPHLPIRLPCYDFTPVIAPALDGFAGLGRERLPWCDGRCVQGPGTYSPQYADLRLLAIPTSCRRVSACNPNWGMFSGVRSGSLLRCPLCIPL